MRVNMRWPSGKAASIPKWEREYAGGNGGAGAEHWGWTDSQPHCEISNHVKSMAWANLFKVFSKDQCCKTSGLTRSLGVCPSSPDNKFCSARCAMAWRV